MALAPSLGLKNIDKSVNSLALAITRIKKSSFMSSSILMKKTKVKKSALFEDRRIFQLKKESVRIKDQENLIEFSKLVSPVQKATASISRSTQGFLGRILEFTATLITGWLLYNLPTLIAMAKELMGRITRMVNILKGFVTNLGSVMTGFGNVLGATFKNIISLDFNDTSKRVETAMKGLNNTFSDMQSQIDEGLKLLTTPLTKGLVTGEEAPEFGTRFPAQPEAGEPTPSVSGTKYPQLSSIIVKGEGGLNSVNRGRAGDTPGGAKSVLGRNLTDMTVGEVMQAQREGRVSAVGKYQFIPGTLAGAVKHTKMPLNAKFDKTTQDRLFDYLIEVKRPIVGKYLKGQSNNKREAIQELAREFASVGLEYPEAGRRRGQSRYAGLAGNRASISPETIGNVLDSQRQAGPSQVNVASSSSLTSPAQITPTALVGAPTQPAAPQALSSGNIFSPILPSLTAPQSQLIPSKAATSTSTPPSTTQQKPKLDLKKLGFSVGERAGYSSSRGRVHAGRDIAIDSGTPVSVITDATITDVNYERGYGYYVTYLDSRGIEHFYGHLRKLPKVKKGQKLPAGTIVGYVGSTGRSTGPHLHWEVSPRIGEVGRPRKNIIDPLEYGFSATAPFSGTSVAPAQIAAQTQQRQQLPIQLAPERQGPQIILIDDIQPQQPTMPMGGSGGGAIIPIIINPLNSYITNKLMLDLAYT